MPRCSKSAGGCWRATRRKGRSRALLSHFRTRCRRRPSASAPGRGWGRTNCASCWTRGAAARCGSRSEGAPRPRRGLARWRSSSRASLRARARARCGSVSRSKHSSSSTTPASHASLMRMPRRRRWASRRGSRWSTSGATGSRRSALARLARPAHQPCARPSHQQTQTGASAWVWFVRPATR